MPRDGSNIYSQPFPDVVEDTTIESTVYNGFTNDVALDLNTPRPIVAGGTGATNADQALFNLAAEKATQVVTNYDSHLWVPGSFRSSTTPGQAAPVDGHAFAGVCYIGEALAYPPTNQNVVVEATDTTDAASTTKYIRIKTAGVWSSWTGVSSGSAATSVGEYTTDSGITFPPGSGQIRLNNVTQNSATEIFISHLTVTGTDNTNLIPFVIKVGSDIAIQDKDEIAKYKIFTATANPVLSGSDYRVTVTFKSGGTDLGLAQRVMVGATGGGTVSYTTPQTLTETQETQARSNVYAAPFDALMYNGMQINGNGEIDQQNGGAAVQVTTSSGTMRPADGWQVIVIQASGAVNIGAHQTAASLPGHPLMVRTVAQNANFLAGTNGDALYLRHAFEGYRVSRLGWGTAGAVPLSYAMRVHSIASGTLAIRFFNGSVNRFYYVEHAVVGGTWNWIAGTIPADTSGTWLVTNGVGLYMDIIFGGKEASPAVPNTWVGGSVKAQTTSSTNLMGALNNAVSITGFIAVPGTELPSVDRIAYIMRPSDVELPMCLRYYWRDAQVTYFFADGISAGASVNTLVFPVFYPVLMRAAPVITVPTFTTSGLLAAPVASASTSTRGSYITATSNASAGTRIYYVGNSGAYIADARL